MARHSPKQEQDPWQQSLRRCRTIARRRRSQGVIEFLEEWLEMAKRGEVQAVAVVAVTDGRELLSGRFENNHWAGLLAAHDMSRHNMLTAAYSVGRRA